MLYPSTEVEIMSRHREMLRDAATYRRHFGVTRPGRVLVGILAFSARVARRTAERFEASLDLLNGCEDADVQTKATVF